jgi:hypothetical protein
MKELIISANVSAETLARPTTLGSLFMHFSHARHAFSIAGTRVFGAHRFSRYSFEHTAISCSISTVSISGIKYYQRNILQLSDLHHVELCG